FVDPGVWLQEYDVPVRSAGWIEVRHRFGNVGREVQKQRSACEHVELLHANADGQDGKLPFDDSSDQDSVARVATIGHRLNAVRHRLAVPSRVYAEPASQYHAVEPVE